MVDQGPTDPTSCQLLYDGACPVCSRFAAVAARAEEGHLTVVDARAASELRQKATAAGMNLDYGVVVAVDDRLHYGADALVYLARRPSGSWRSWLYRPFRSRTVAHLLYPLFVRLRWLLLWLGRKSLIRNLPGAGP